MHTWTVDIVSSTTSLSALKCNRNVMGLKYLQLVSNIETYNTTRYISILFSLVVISWRTALLLKADRAEERRFVQSEDEEAADDVAALFFRPFCCTLDSVTEYVFQWWRWDVSGAAESSLGSEKWAELGFPLSPSWCFTLDSQGNYALFILVRHGHWSLIWKKLLWP